MKSRACPAHDALALQSRMANDQYPKPPFPPQTQQLPGSVSVMSPVPDHGETSYRGSGKLQGKVALITGGDSGIGRAVAIAYAREGADVAISYLNEEDDARDTAKLVEAAGQRSLLLPGDLADRAHCKAIVEKTVGTFGKLDIIVNNAAYQNTFDSIEEITDDEWDRTFSVNISAMFRIVKAAIPHLKEGASVINTTSIQADNPSPSLLAYASTKGAIHNFTGGLSQMLGKKGIRVNCVAPGPIWTPLIPATMPVAQSSTFGKDTPMGRPGQPAELAAAYVFLASAEASYVAGATIAVTGGKPIL
jgi:NAD(P)-dependent dehydrogenase (short-subunit alcohol dehydrogenase family)